MTGLDRLAADGFSRLHGKRIAVLANQASVDSGLRHLFDGLGPLHREGKLRVAAVFGPQHGLFGHTQDNMIEWEGHVDPRYGWTVFSLYGEHRRPTQAMLRGIDLFLVDIPDIGSRYYTFAWTMAHCMAACEEAGIPLLVLDRPNPIGGVQVEGTVLREGFESFVGLHPLPTRHGMTAGELARYFQARFYPRVSLEAVPVAGWSRAAYLDETGIPWCMPSPNMPTLDTAFVYPGACLLEATNLSEGRGTTRPFEIVGAPFLNGWKLADSLNAKQLPGVYFRPVQFQPTFNKHAGRVCEGVFTHVTDRRGFMPVLTSVALLQETIRQTGIHALDEAERGEETFVAASAECDLPGFAWKRPPYEYERDRWPIEILAGNDWLRRAIEERESLDTITARFRDECEAFESERSAALQYE